MIWYCMNALAHEKACLDVDAAAFITSDRVAKYLTPSFKFLIIGEGGHSWELHRHLL